MSRLSHTTFVASFVLTFAVLVFTSNFLGAQLEKHGYRVGDLILIGLPKKNITTTTRSSSTSAMSGGLFAFEALKDFNRTQVLSLALAVVSTVYIVWKAAAPSMPAVFDPRVVLT